MCIKPMKAACYATRTIFMVLGGCPVGGKVEGGYRAAAHIHPGRHSGEAGGLPGRL
jgi:hypothetical protein